VVSSVGQPRKATEVPSKRAGIQEFAVFAMLIGVLLLSLHQSRQWVKSGGISITYGDFLIKAGGLYQRARASPSSHTVSVFSSS
jgi:hypothetical protein